MQMKFVNFYKKTMKVSSHICFNHLNISLITNIDVEPETNFEPYIVPSSKEFQITNNKAFSKFNSVYAERKKLLFGEDCQSDSEENTRIDNIIDKEEQKVQSGDNIRERANKFRGKVRLNNRSRNFNRTISEIDQRLIIVNNELSDLRIELANLRQERKTLKKRRRRIVKSANKLNNRMVKNQDIFYANNHKEASSNSPVRKSLRKINSVIGSVSGSLLEAASASLSRSGSVSGSKSGSPHAYISTDTTNKNFNQDGTFGSNLAEYNDSIHTINEKSRENFSIRSIVPWLNFSRHENENENEIENSNRISDNQDELMALEDKFKKERKIKSLRPIRDYRDQIEYSNDDDYCISNNYKSSANFSNSNTNENQYSISNLSESVLPTASPSRTIKNSKLNPDQQENMYHTGKNDSQEGFEEEVSDDEQNSEDNGNKQDVDSPETEALNCFKFLSILSDEEFVTRISETERLLNLS